MNRAQWSNRHFVSAFPALAMTQRGKLGGGEKKGKDKWVKEGKDQRAVWSAFCFTHALPLTLGDFDELAIICST